MQAQNRTHKLTVVGAVILALLLGVSVFKHISYPLLWNDEAETAEFGNRILEFGYPKIHDGKNVLYLLDHPDQSLMVREKLDAFVGMGWVQYYFAAPGAALAKLTSNPYLKTAIMRIPFALAGLFGLLVLALVPLSFGGTKAARWRFVALFILLELLSVSLALHLREVRYYSLVITLGALAIYCYTKRRLHPENQGGGAGWGLAVSLILLFNTFSPAYAVLLISLTIEALLDSKRNHRTTKDWWRLLWTRPAGAMLWRQLWPLAASLVAVIPSAIFFKTLTINQGFRAYFQPGFYLYLYNLKATARFFAQYEFLIPLLVIKVGLAELWRHHRAQADVYDERCYWYSTFLTRFAIIYWLVVSTIPYPTFERYALLLQPLFASVLALDGLLLVKLLQQTTYPAARRLRWWTAALVVLSTLIYLPTKLEAWSGHLYELRHQYQGPLDVVIPYLRQHYADPSTITIATNYEEPAYMYYLGSRVTVGFVFNNIANDAKLLPDVIIRRRSPIAYQESVGRMVDDVFNQFLAQAPYQVVHFPIVDYPFNNIPELSYFRPHLFRTPTTTDPQAAISLYLRQ